MPLLKTGFYDFSPYTISRVSQFKGHEGEPLVQGILNCDGKYAADWSDDFRGGAPEIGFKSNDDRVKLLAFLRAKNFDFYQDCSAEDMKNDFFVLDQFLMELTMQAAKQIEFKRITKKNALAYEILDPSLGRIQIPQTFVTKLAYTEENVAKMSEQLDREGKHYRFLNAELGNPFATDAEATEFMENNFKSLSKNRVIVKVRLEDGKISYLQFAGKCTLERQKLIKDRYGSNLIEILNLRWMK